MSSGSPAESGKGPISPKGGGDGTNRSLSLASAVSGSTISAAGRQNDKTFKFPTPTGTPKSSGTPQSASRRSSFLGIKRPTDIPLPPHQPRSRMDSPRLSLSSPRLNAMDVVRADEVSLPTMLPPSDGSGSPMLSPRVRGGALPPKVNSR